MASSKINNYVKKELKKGFSPRVIKSALLKAGYDKPEVNSALEELSPRTTTPHGLIARVFVFVIIIAIIITGTVYVVSNLKSSIVKTECNKLSTQPEKDVCLIKLAASTSNLDYCDGIESHNLFYACKDQYWTRTDCTYQRLINQGLDECYSNLALIDKEVQRCQSVEDHDIKVDCVRTMAQTAVDTGDLSYCGEDPYCYTRYALYTDDPTACEQFPGENPDVCYFGVAMNFNRTGECSRIRDRDMKDDCFLVMARRMQTEATCDYIDSESKKGECVLLFLTPESGKEKCNTETDDPLIRDGCLFNVATTTREFELCDEINTIELREGCYLSFAKVESDPEKCNLISDKDSKAICYAIIEKDINQCDNIINELTEEYCFAFFNSDISICKKLYPQSENSGLYIEMCEEDILSFNK